MLILCYVLQLISNPLVLTQVRLVNVTSAYPQSALKQMQSMKRQVFCLSLPRKLATSLGFENLDKGGMMSERSTISGGRAGGSGGGG